jgi:RimJ/RimL family protein N-acetyltransferase
MSLAKPAASWSHISGKRHFLTIVAGNEESVAVARRAGFVYEGRMRSHGIWQGRRCDVMWFAALPLEWTMRGPDEQT